MKFKISPPVTIANLSYSTLDMVRYLVRNDRRYNRTAEDARAGKRTVAAFELSAEEVELSEADLRILADVVERPSTGSWGVFGSNRRIPRPMPDGSTQEVDVPTRTHVPAFEFLPLIDPIATAARSLPPLPAK